MRRFWYALALAILSCSTPPPPGGSQAWDELLAYKDRAIQSAEERARIGRIVDRLLPNPPDRGWDTRPSNVWEVPFPDGRSRVIVFEGHWGPIGIPGNCEARIHLFTGSGTWRKTAQFSTGWRLAQEEASIALTREHGVLITLPMVDCMNGPDISRLCFAFLDEEAVLVRLERESGEATRNYYYAENWRIGPALPEQEEEAWEESLHSKSRVEVLRALIWLGGIHRDPGSGRDFSGSESPESVRLWERTRTRPRVKARLIDLRTSEDQWIRESARLAESPQTYR